MKTVERRGRVILPPIIIYVTLVHGCKMNAGGDVTRKSEVKSKIITMSIFMRLRFWIPTSTSCVSEWVNNNNNWGKKKTYLSCLLGMIDKHYLIIFVWFCWKLRRNIIIVNWKFFFFYLSDFVGIYSDFEQKKILNFLFKFILFEVILK